MTEKIVIDAGTVVTVDDDDRILDNHSLIIEEGLIRDIVPYSEVSTAAPDTRRIDRRDHLVMPGLINAHTHLAMNLLRGIADDLPLMTWLQEHIWPAEGQWVDPQFVADGTELALAESLLGGVTCVNDMYFFPDQVAAVASRVGLRATVGLIILEFPTVWASSADEYLSKGLALHDKLKGDPLVRTALAPHAPYTVSSNTLERVNQFAAELDIPIHMHVHETRAEVDNFVSEHGKRPLQLLEELGMLNPSLLAVHMTQLNDAEIESVAGAGVHVLHCPESNMKLASGTCPSGPLAASDVNIALGTDGAASNNDLDMFGEARSAAFLAKLSTGDASAIPAKTAIRMATINGARALGIDQLTGSLEPGKAADCITISCTGVDMVPMYNPLSHLIYATDRSKVNDVWVAGQQLVRNRQLTTIDAAAIEARAREWAVKISTTAGT